MPVLDETLLCQVTIMPNDPHPSMFECQTNHRCVWRSTPSMTKPTTTVRYVWQIFAPHVEAFALQRSGCGTISNFSWMEEQPVVSGPTTTIGTAVRCHNREQSSIRWMEWFVLHTHTSVNNVNKLVKLMMNSLQSWWQCCYHIGNNVTGTRWPCEPWMM